MTINTKYDAGQDVYILNNSNVVKSTIMRVTTEKSFYNDGDTLIMYYFARPDGMVGEIYRYENEVGATITELIRGLAPKETISSNVTDDLDELQQL